MFNSSLGHGPGGSEPQAPPFLRSGSPQSPAWLRTGGEGPAGQAALPVLELGARLLSCCPFFALQAHLNKKLHHSLKEGKQRAQLLLSSPAPPVPGYRRGGKAHTSDKTPRHPPHCLPLHPTAATSWDRDTQPSPGTVAPVRPQEPSPRGRDSCGPGSRPRAPRGQAGALLASAGRQGRD